MSHTEYSLGKNAGPDNEHLISVCFPHFGTGHNDKINFLKTYNSLKQRFRFFEIIIVLDEKNYSFHLSLIEEIPKIRTLVVRDDVSYYTRRLIAARESVGDLVVLANLNDLSYFDVTDLVKASIKRHKSIFALADNSGILRNGVFGFWKRLGQLAGFSVDWNILQSVCLPRSELSQYLAHPEPELSLRFPPVSPKFNVDFYKIENFEDNRRLLGALGRRMALIHRVLIHLAPFFLQIVCYLSFILTLFGVFFAVYILNVWIFVAEIAEGWLTTSLMQSVLAIFFGLVMSGISLGQLQLIRQSVKEQDQNILREVNKNDIFAGVKKDLNVDIISK